MFGTNLDFSSYVFLYMLNVLVRQKHRYDVCFSSTTWKMFCPRTFTVGTPRNNDASELAGISGRWERNTRPRMLPLDSHAMVVFLGVVETAAICFVLTVMSHCETRETRPTKALESRDGPSQDAVFHAAAPRRDKLQVRGLIVMCIYCRSGDV